MGSLGFARWLNMNWIIEINNDQSKCLMKVNSLINFPSYLVPIFYNAVMTTLLFLTLFSKPKFALKYIHNIYFPTISYFFHHHVPLGSPYKRRVRKFLIVSNNSRWTITGLIHHFLEKHVKTWVSNMIDHAF